MNLLGSFPTISVNCKRAIAAVRRESAFGVMQMDEQYDLCEYVDRLYSAALKKTGDSYVAEDIAQETFLAAIGQLSRGKRPDNLWAWLLCILSNKHCDWLREKYNKPRISFEDYPFEIAAEKSPDDDTEEKLEAVRRELGYLAQIHREVLVRFYIHGHALEKIAQDLQIPVGTVKSRLSIGRQHIRKGVADMENYTKQSYEPDILRIACSGGVGLHNEPFSLVEDSDKLSQNVLILAYQKPVTEAELAKQLGVPTAYVEPVAEKLVNGELMCRTEGGKVYTDFILYADSDRKATFQKQMEVAGKHFDLFWEGAQAALSELRRKAWYKRQPEHAQAKLELHFLTKLLMNVQTKVRGEVAGEMPYSDYPHRRDGGRWFAMGMQYPADYRYEQDRELWMCDVSGEFGYPVRRFRDAASVELRGYDTGLGRYNNGCFEDQLEYAKWFYELLTEIPQEESAVRDHVLQTAGNLVDSGILRREGGLKLDLPALTLTEYWEESSLISAYVGTLAGKVREVLLPVFETGRVKLPAHLKSVPKWQRYMYCGDKVPMAVICEARKKGLFLEGADYPLPAVLLVYEKA